MTEDDLRALSWGVADHVGEAGAPLGERFRGLAADVANASSLGLYQYFRTHQAAVTSLAAVRDQAGRATTGLNGASQDYLGLAGDPRVTEAAKAAIDRWGAHSAGSGPMGGRIALAVKIEDVLSRQLGLDWTCLFPTGWAAGYGAIKALLRPGDHVVLDSLAHNCLQHGAQASGARIHLFPHNDLDGLERRLARIRRDDPAASILVITEALFSMDSDTPDLARVVEIKARHGAHLLLDVAHDFGCLGPGGAGLMAEAAGSYEGVDYVIGSFSKTFASIGGFFASNDEGALRAVQAFSGSFTFSNYPIPAQLGAIRAAMDIVFSLEGNERRAAMLANVRRLRDGLVVQGMATLGRPSAMAIAVVGSEARARLAYREILVQGVIVNCIEFPAVRRGESRFRIQLSPDWRQAEIDRIAEAVGEGLRRADRLDGESAGQRLIRGKLALPAGE
ncbi:hypothetical protein Rumeso_03041 [Rubellimicrobium mesophilum DSM 19309]|uniref:Aminotransferase class I/classII large domain-containing protein n=1 Tax=Rubellimicrobium mesophilum DSM 19309 TaxID=442562 RepID=A0A017HNM8_9RHOB|nr:pyridoxal phosphate-dependent aminotransferase family protein [Rubellimicrobium mesophilum]EYD75394.1 hypothetical protein Rumeso_03041 [Rubellimicrobium mesophilum DSM 19309]